MRCLSCLVGCCWAEAEPRSLLPPGSRDLTADNHGACILGLRMLLSVAGLRCLREAGVLYSRKFQSLSPILLSGLEFLKSLLRPYIASSAFPVQSPSAMKFALLVACVELAAAATRYDNATLGNGTSSMVHSGASVTTSYEGLGFSTNPTSHTAASSKGLAKWILNGLGGGGAESGMTSTLSSTLDHSDKNGQLSHTSTWASHSSLSATNSSALLEKGDSVGLSGAGSSNVSTAPLYTSGSGLANSRFPDSADLNGSTTTMMAGWQVTNISGPATHGSAAIPTRPVLNNNTSGNSSAMTTSPFLRNHSIPQDYFSYGNVTFRTVCTVSDRIASKSCMNVCNDYKEQCSDALLEWTEAASSSLVAYHTTYITHTTNITTWPAGVSASKVVYVGHTHVPQETWFTYSSITFLSGGRTHTWSSKISSVVVPETVVTYTSTYSRVNAEPITLQSHEVREGKSSFRSGSTQRSHQSR